MLNSEHETLDDMVVLRYFEQIDESKTKDSNDYLRMLKKAHSIDEINYSDSLIPVSATLMRVGEHLGNIILKMIQLHLNSQKQVF